MKREYQRIKLNFVKIILEEVKNPFAFRIHIRIRNRQIFK